jgi:hypothetical protein
MTKWLPEKEMALITRAASDDIEKIERNLVLSYNFEVPREKLRALSSYW